jgi:glycosyltransferase involved in cell wall biosynthesis
MLRMSMSLVILVGGWLIFSFWLVGVAPSLISLLWRSLDSVVATLKPPTAWPKVSIIVPARDEAAKIEAAMRSKLAIDYPNFELIAVDDRSQDATGPILDRLAAEDSRLRVIHLDSLPEDWLGKSHAMHVAAARATGDYLLFTDADVFFAADVLRKAVTMCEGRRLDHLTLAPHLECRGFFEQVLHAYFFVLLCIGAQPWLVRTPFRMSYLGMGAFNMVRRAAYDRVGGHAAIRLDVLDDVKLGKLIKLNGLRQDALDANGGLRVQWQESFFGVIRGLEKNGFAIFDYSLVKLFAYSAIVVLFQLFPYAAIVIWPDLRGGGWLASLVFLHLATALTAQLLGSSSVVSLGLPVAIFALLYTMWRSAYLTLSRQGVRWRDTFYPLSLLRENVY